MNIVVATWNKSKLKRITRGLQQTGLTINGILSNIEDIEETESTFSGNARLKVDAVRRTNLTSIIVGEDSGLSVEALQGFPGVKTARFLEGTDDDRAEKLLELLQGVPPSQRKATFHSAIVVSFPDGTYTICEGYMNGWISTTRIQGKGYAGIFLLSNHLVLAEQPNNEYMICNHHRQALFQAVLAIQDWLERQ
ncbi:non-canonical purine NTP pyrophosphatase [Alkalihalobacillus sp. LMS39]|uniref:non-canonical purine NTP pyrophosphatase n=1 Tax=Alkalihalobacillus sp. LMS39 TaxID=2924032 RepID=UPI001FB2238D|nr:non-canonical purine NTP pyrophosphatase [Alkalihalobacillus sp. LMS39]UOE94437.1 non-canonical purine NTP pyrophosphatase [Alkalihalobacillus sp. LMS39]